MVTLTLAQADMLLGGDVFTEDDAAFDRYDADEAREWAALPYPRPLGERHTCGYRVDAVGHRLGCEAAS